MVNSSSGSVPINQLTDPPNESSDDSAFASLLLRARKGDTDALGVLLQWYVNYLNILASTQLDHRLRRRVNPSDLLQEAMLAAHRDFGDFHGNSQAELLGWLRQILIHTLHRNFSRHVKAKKRDVRREVSMDEISQRVEESACQMATILPSRVESPSSPMQQREQSVALAHQLSRLRPHYRDIIVYRVIQSLPFDEIAKKMNRSNGAVRMLWLRALEAFKSECELHHE